MLVEDSLHKFKWRSSFTSSYNRDVGITESRKLKNPKVGQPLVVWFSYHLSLKFVN
jgi:hypothetical protein